MLIRKAQHASDLPAKEHRQENNLNDFLVQRNLNIGIQPKQYIQLAILAVEEYWAC